MKDVTSLLNRLLASYQMYYQNLRGFHWNIEGRDFFSLHAKFEEYYDEASESIDEVAERIRSLGKTPLHTFKEYIDNAAIEPAPNVANGVEAVKITLQNVQTLHNLLLEILQEASESGDEGTASFVSGQIEALEKRMWMLKAYLK